eukprot:CAMPEP_0183750874 /NCGR_PEP_ID=MMETSP0739-20130205/1386_1 /TAXON_ID=385413 /ORGANISM="Thalassiosira miniscula, Strain CCMP1093" /LENGTH=52 /DNA_ID=CAMNT_0025987019 /DNA_START=126 /DNA_END=281 /DNA_ORIENTATION=+
MRFNSITAAILGATSSTAFTAFAPRTAVKSSALFSSSPRTLYDKIWDDHVVD